MSADAVLERLGEDVWDALAKTCSPAPEGSGEDGFEVLADPSQPEVAVVLRLEGPLSGCGTPGVRRGFFARWERALAAAGFLTRRREADDEVPLVLYVTRTDETRSAR
jgi:hypothetical protein